MRVDSGTVTFDNCNIHNNQATTDRVRAVSHASFPTMGCLLLYDFVISVQGGGVFVNGGDVTFNNCDIHNNQGFDVRA